MTRVSIIICTKNRAEDLRSTLETLNQVRVPKDLSVEVIVVDNASSDHTEEVIKVAASANPVIRAIQEPRVGQTFCYNKALSESQGNLLLFTDDDLRLPENWIEAMTRPILDGKAHALLGAIKIAPHLEKDWMESYHRSWFETSRERGATDRIYLIGANMALSRNVLRSVPRFDVELGPGALGFSADWLFSEQLHEAGYEIKMASGCFAEHHFDPVRLTRGNLLNRFSLEGRSSAYLAYHWHHLTETRSYWKLFKAVCLIAKLRCKQQILGKLAFPPSQMELNLMACISYLRQYLVEKRRPRNYAKRGCVKLHGVQ